MRALLNDTRIVGRGMEHPDQSNRFWTVRSDCHVGYEQPEHYYSTQLGSDTEHSVLEVVYRSRYPSRVPQVQVNRIANVTLYLVLPPSSI